MSLMRHSCDKDGCFYRKHVVKFDTFADCFGGKINFTDVDSIVEVNGQFLTADWKHPSHREPQMGQDILFKQLSRLPQWTCLIVAGDCERMTIHSFCQYRSGLKGPWQMCDLREFKMKLRNWYDNAARTRRTA